jgi:hypothetical protein
MYKQALAWLLGFVMALASSIAAAEDINTNNTNTNNTTINSDTTSTNTNTNINTNTNTSTSTNTNNNTNVNTSTVTSTNTNNNNNNTVSTNTNTNINESTSDSTVRSIQSGETTTNIKSPPPTAVAPAMMSGGNSDLCTTGVSAGVQTQILGIAAGGTVTDLNCERIKLAKNLFDMGMKVAAVSTLCQDARVFSAMEMAGTPCPFMGEIGPKAAAAWEAMPGMRPDYEEYLQKRDYVQKLEEAIANGEDPSTVKKPEKVIKDVPEFLFGAGAGALLLFLLL